MAEHSDTKRHEPSSDDRISNLPDPVLAHILSFLPTQDAVATTSISSNWKFTWKYTNNLRFCHPKHQTRFSSAEINKILIRFLHFVNRVLILHPSKYIHTFSINFENEYVEYDSRVLNNLDTWVTAAVDRNVRYFELCGTWDTQSTFFRIPNCLYNCNSLESLHLFKNVKIDPRGSVRFPNLKILRLVDVDFGCEESFDMLISGCLSLHTLYVRRIGYDNVDTFSVQSQTLEHLTIISCDDYQSFYEESMNRTVFKIAINAPALKYLCLGDEISSEILIDSLPLLTEAKICLHDELIKNRFTSDGNSICSLFQALHLVRRLSLNGFAYTVLRESGVSINFPKLTEITLEDLCCEWNSLWYLLENMTILDVEEIPCLHESHARWIGKSYKS